MREIAERAWFRACLALGRLLRAGRYSTVLVIDQDGERQVRKRRLFYAPILVWLGSPLVRFLNAGIRVLPQREWEEREREAYQTLRGASVQIDGDALILPRLAGETLATVLENTALCDSARKKAIELAAVALAALHNAGLTHADAMAENVMVDLEAGVAHWFDFETVHDPRRPIAWRRADDVRALLATCLVRTVPEQFAETLGLILDVYADEEVTHLVAQSFSSVFRRPLPFHLGQAPLSVRGFRQIAELLKERIASRSRPS